VIQIQKLTKTEYTTLKDHRKSTNSQLLRDRAHAILLSHSGYGVPEIANILFRDPDSIYKWINDFNTSRLASIFPGYCENQNASKLTKEQKEEVKQKLSTPDSLPASFWSLPKLKEYIKERFDVVYESDRAYHYLLEYCGLSFKLPSAFDQRSGRYPIN
jgi:transposase